jgi:hypothetical protein
MAFVTKSPITPFAFALAATLMTIPVPSTAKADVPKNTAIAACLYQQGMSKFVMSDYNATLITFIIPAGPNALEIYDWSPGTPATYANITRLPDYLKLPRLPLLTAKELSPVELSAVGAVRGCMKQVTGYSFSLP